MNKNDAINYFRVEKRAIELFEKNNTNLYAEAGGNERIEALEYAITALEVAPEDLTPDTTKEMTMDELREFIAGKEGEFIISVEMGGE